ncbi:hypothetical protein A2U01_0095519, partial [Trifolium medium]|nr:hypothetical protein [Trifolium medium]
FCHLRGAQLALARRAALCAGGGLVSDSGAAHSSGWRNAQCFGARAVSPSGVCAARS